MQVQSLTYSNPSPQFKSTIPVYHWVAEKGGSYAVPVEKEVIEILHEKMIKAFNAYGYRKPLKDLSFSGAIKMLMDKDPSYNVLRDFVRKTSEKRTLTRSFYNPNGGEWMYNGMYEPYSYLITGSHVKDFNEKYAKPLGIIKSYDPKTEGYRPSADLKMARHQYYSGGLGFVKASETQIKDSGGVRMGLHTKYEIVRDTEGKKIGYKFVDMRFLPETGSENPFVKLSNRKIKK